MVRPVKKFTHESIMLGAGESRTVGLGAYDTTESMPHFELTYEPALHETIGASLERLTIPGKPRYIMVYHFHNFGEASCRITIRRSE